MKKLLVKSLVFASAAMLPAPSMFAQTAAAPIQTQPDRFSYAAKFVCGLSTTQLTQPQPAEPPVKRGNYATTVNVRNPWPNTVILSKHVVVSAPERQEIVFNPPSQRVIEKLPPGNALYVDCQEIVRLLHMGFATPFIEGFVVIESYSQPATTPSVAMEVDVVAVTTAAPVAAAGIADTGVSSHEITPIQGRKLPAGPWPF